MDHLRSEACPYNEYLNTLVEQFDEVRFDHIPRDKNQSADALTTLAAMMDPKLVLYNEYLNTLVERFDEVQFEYIRRDKNQFADTLATLAAIMDLENKGEMDLIQINQQEVPAYCLAIEQEPDGKPWFFNILQYIKNQEYHENLQKQIRKPFAV